MMTNKEIFDEMKEKVLEKNKGDFFIISPTHLGAAISETGRARIKNAIIIVKQKEEQKEWLVEQYKLKSCPESFILCVKKIDNVAFCIGEQGSEQSYHFYKHMNDKAPESLFIIGAIEMDDEVIGFCYDWEQKKSHYLYLEKESEEDSEFFSLMSKMRQLEVISHGAHQEETHRFW